MNCDRIARIYRWMEYAAFGGALQRRRCEFLGRVGRAKTALVVGDGDGRFLAELHKRYPAMEVDSIELSSKMLALSRKRVSSPGVRFFHADALSVPFPRGRYDLIATHFFLDCLSDADASKFIARVSAVANADVCWIVSEFRIPAGGWRALHAKVWIATMYLLFRLTTGLSARRIPAYQESLMTEGFRLDGEVTERFGLIGSECWIRKMSVTGPEY
ncbi:MAG: class I SAM-dependent methyltransferase [Bryobacteraceae bacterium]